MALRLRRPAAVSCRVRATYACFVLNMMNGIVAPVLLSLRIDTSSLIPCRLCCVCLAWLFLNQPLSRWWWPIIPARFELWRWRDCIPYGFVWATIDVVDVCVLLMYPDSVLLTWCTVCVMLFVSYVEMFLSLYAHVLLLYTHIWYSGMRTLSPADFDAEAQPCLLSSQINWPDTHTVLLLWLYCAVIGIVYCVVHCTCCRCVCFQCRCVSVYLYTCLWEKKNSFSWSVFQIQPYAVDDTRTYPWSHLPSCIMSSCVGFCVWLCVHIVECVVVCIHRCVCGCVCTWLCCVFFVHAMCIRLYICCMRGEETQWFIRTRVSEGHSVLLKRTLSWLSERNSMCVESDDVIQRMMCTTSTLVVDCLCFCVFVFLCFNNALFFVFQWVVPIYTRWVLFVWCCVA